ncbi:hypothetical protein [Amycolatopsis lurida]|uniref:hypothetical protein n=1 Tax=Amycolatopsis lurida TaxID=31959 RepID=UPI001301167F|nr:hypothetical protein [Amycolatopsis lurida]
MSDEYVMPRTMAEAERLQLQAKIMDPYSAHLSDWPGWVRECGYSTPVVASAT